MVLLLTSSYKTLGLLQNCPPRMTGKSKVTFKRRFLLKHATKQNTKIKIIIYPCLLTKAAMLLTCKHCFSALYRSTCTQQSMTESTVFCFSALFPQNGIAIKIKASLNNTTTTTVITLPRKAQNPLTTETEDQPTLCSMTQKFRLK